MISVPQNRQTELTLREMAVLPAYPIFDLAPLVVDVSWARGIRIYLDIEIGDGTGPIYMRTARHFTEAGKGFVESVRDLSTLTTVGDYESGALTQYIDAVPMPTVDSALNFWFDCDGVMFLSISLSEDNAGLVPTQASLVAIPQYRTPR